VSCGGKGVADLAALQAAERAAAGVFDLVVYRNQEAVKIEIRPW